MECLILGGASEKNKKRVDSVGLTLSEKNLFNVINWHYLHWNDSNIDFNMAEEQKRLYEYCNNIDSDYIIICKSIGAILLFLSRFAIKNKPQKVYVFGLPINYIDSNMAKTIESIVYEQSSIVFHQNSEDPAGSHNDIVSLLPNISIVPFVGDTHNYSVEDVLRVMNLSI